MESRERWEGAYIGRSLEEDEVGSGRGTRKGKKKEQEQEIDTYTLRDAEVLVFVARRVDGRKACGRSVASQ